jgi:hypothetical protein
LDVYLLDVYPLDVYPLDIHPSDVYLLDVYSLDVYPSDVYLLDVYSLDIYSSDSCFSGKCPYGRGFPCRSDENAQNGKNWRKAWLSRWKRKKNSWEKSIL